jgi:hypothetical protein
LQYGKDQTANESKYADESGGDKLDAYDVLGQDELGGSDVSECMESETSEYVPHGLEYLNDNYILIDIDSEEDELTLLFPRDKSRKNIFPGGPQKPDVSMCTESGAKVFLQSYAKARKAYTDKQQIACVKSDKSLLKIFIL